ncbi:aldehyde dehydrogenase family protein [Patescibacteria group bacterium]|nr:aldehyde dehydrogenase family protein [Patescibacteria group bacterium]MBU1473056.1 aldehyde dehydrogenase family protein [Patescibacteria group bacterium]MBU2460188.1 aldehyde dehydrogenase family protein [Patescibacteria group bacterium]MBU2543925.1 aldehyde dehydrogenase family protein [Patescibacteria group bacterium]
MPAEFFSEISNHATPPTYRFFDGAGWKESTSAATSDVTSPIQGEILGRLQVVTHQEIDQALANAQKAQPQWESTPLHQRVKIMHLSADWIRHFRGYLASLLIKEIGKTDLEAQGEIDRTADLIDYFADEVQSIRGETLDSDNFPGFDKGRLAMIERVAYGVVVAIAPFNYPVNLAASKIVPALLMGNSVVFKPPTQGGISGVHLTRLFEKAGVPQGVLSCITGGGGDIGDYLVGHSGVDMLAFTGGSDTGVHIAKQAGMVPMLFECGGNNPAVVLPDADLALAAREIVRGAFSYSGQRCTAIKYVLTTESILNQLLPQVLNNIKEMVRMGDPRSPETKLVGPVISPSAAEKILQAISESVGLGAKIEIGGKRKDALVEPTVLTHVKSQMPVVAHEIFGPLVSFIQVASFDEASEIINSSNYGLQASIFTRDEGTGINFAKNLKVGSVQINGSPQRGPDHFPFLGVKHSGVGVQGVRYSLEAMSRLKPVVLNKPQ